MQILFMKSSTIVDIVNVMLHLYTDSVLNYCLLCLSQFQLGTSWWVDVPAGYVNPRENFFDRANPGHPGNFLSNSLPQGKKMTVELPAAG